MRKWILFSVLVGIACFPLFGGGFSTNVITTNVGGKVVAVVPNATQPYLSDLRSYVFLATPNLSLFRTPQEFEAGAKQEQEDDEKVLTLTERSVEILRGKCANCHTEGKRPKGGFTLFLRQGTLKETLDIEAITEEIVSGRMPKNESLTDEEIHELGFVHEQFSDTEENSEFVID